SFAGTMRRRGAEFPVILAALKEMNSAQCTEPGTEAEIRKIAEGISKKPAGQADWALFTGQDDDSEGAAASPGDEHKWRDKLLHGKPQKVGEPGPILANLANAITTLRHSSEWVGVLGFNEFSLGVVAVKPTPWQDAASAAEWTDHEDRLTADWLQHHGI